MWAQAVASHFHPAPVPAAADSAQDLAAELVHYGFVHEVCGPAQLGWEGTQQSLPLCRTMPPSHPAG